MSFDENIHIAYKKYLDLPLATIQSETEIYRHMWVILTGRSIVSPHPHRHYTLIEFAYWCGKNQTLYDRFLGGRKKNITL